jgi:Zn-dependent oligopeptidase
MEKIKDFNLDISQFNENNLNIVHFYNLIHPDQEIKKRYQEIEREWNLKMKDKSGVSNNFISDLTNKFRENIKESIDWDCLDFCDDAVKREETWLRKNNRGYPDNIENTKELLKRCKDEAKKKGFNSWAHYQADSLGGLDFVKNKLKEYREKIEPSYNTLMKKFAELNDEVVNSWDISYLLSKYKKSKKDINWKEISLDECLSKIFEIWKNMNITTELSDIELVGVNLRIITVFLNDDKIGDIILDCYPHEGKYKRGLSTVVIPRSDLQKYSVSYSTVVIDNTNNLKKRVYNFSNRIST